MVVHHSVLPHIVVHEDVGSGSGVAATLHEDFAGVFVATVVGKVVLDDEHNVVIVIAVMEQCLVHGKGIGLMAVVAP